MTKKLVAEAFGTFVLVTLGAGSACAGGTLIDVAFAHGLAILAMIHAIGEVSGCHINPAVTFGLTLAKRMDIPTAAGYIGSQLVGALLAALLLHWIFPWHPGNLGATLPSPNFSYMDAGQIFAVEVILTAILMFVIMSVVTGAKEKGLIAAIAIGLTVTADIFFGGPLTGASMNPARSFGPAIVSKHTELLWIYLTAPFVGAAAGVGLSTFLHSNGAAAKPTVR